MSKKEDEEIVEGFMEAGIIEPGASSETMLVTTDSLFDEEYAQELSSNIVDKNKEGEITIIKETDDAPVTSSTTSQISQFDCTDDSEVVRNNFFLHFALLIFVESNAFDFFFQDDVAQLMRQNSLDADPLRCKEWLAQKKHIFILSQAGKPIYSRHSAEDKLVTVMGVMQALVSFVQAGNDMIRSVHAGDSNFVFVVKGPLILVSVSKTLESVPQLVLQLT